MSTAILFGWLIVGMLAGAGAAIGVCIAVISMQRTPRVWTGGYGGDDLYVGSSGPTLGHADAPAVRARNLRLVARCV
jgi:hypothetical protein